MADKSNDKHKYKLRPLKRNRFSFVKNCLLFGPSCQDLPFPAQTSSCMVFDGTLEPGTLVSRQPGYLSIRCLHRV